MTNTVTFTSGYWANTDQSCAICETVERGSVAVSVDRAELWAEMQTAIAAGALVMQPMPGLTASDCSAAIEQHFDAVAQARGYKNGDRLASYRASTNATWSAEAQAFIAWRDNVWLFAYSEFAKVQAGQRAIPSVAGLVAELPAIAWP